MSRFLTTFALIALIAPCAVHAGQLRVLDHSVELSESAASFTFTFDRAPEFGRIDPGEHVAYDTFLALFDLDGGFGLPTAGLLRSGPVGTTGEPRQAVESAGPHRYRAHLVGGDVKLRIHSDGTMIVAPANPGFDPAGKPFDPMPVAYTIDGDTLRFELPPGPLGSPETPGGISFLAMTYGTAGDARLTTHPPNWLRVFGHTPIDYAAAHHPPRSITLATADFDLDGDVDGFDLGLWQAHFADDGPDGDADFDGDTDGFDLGLWQSALGYVAPEIDASAAIPAPATGIILLGLAACSAVTRRPSIAR